MRTYIALAAALSLAACGGNEPAAEEPANNVAAPAEIDVLPPDESAATPTDELADGVANTPEGDNVAPAE